MPERDVLIIGQGLAGSCVAWSLHWTGRRVVLVDRGEEITASKIAAGLMTPVTGRRLVPTPRYAELHRQSVEFYRRIESEMHCRLLVEKPAIRQFLNDNERTIFQQKLQPCGSQFIPINDGMGCLTGFEMRDAARLYVSQFLEQTRLHFASIGRYHRTELNIDADIVIHEGGATVARLGIHDADIVFCQGYQQIRNPWYPAIPDSPARGEILRIKLSDYHEDAVVHKGVWLVPDTSDSGEAVFLVGATYDRNRLDNTPTTTGRTELLTGLRQITAGPVEVLAQVAAVRAGTKRRRPVVGRHPDIHCLFLLNGLGSHGALLAPVAARALNDLICDIPLHDDLDDVIDFLPAKHRTRSTTDKIRRPKSLTQLAHNVIRRIAQPGDTVIDATAGNGNDTHFLATLVGTTGVTIAIDIQQSAIDAASKRLADSGLTADFRLADHAMVLEYLKSSELVVRAVMFNLGYLPGSDKQITTTGTSTQTAIQCACDLLSPGGAITIIAYRGHTGGIEETLLVEQLIFELPVNRYETSRIEGDPGNPTSPVLFIVKKSNPGSV